MPRSSDCHSLTHCACCGYGARFHRLDYGHAVTLLGRLALIEGRRRFICSVCIANLKPAARLALLRKSPA